MALIGPLALLSQNSQVEANLEAANQMFLFPQSFLRAFGWRYGLCGWPEGPESF
jgi:hypothetical protein